MIKKLQILTVILLSALVFAQNSKEVKKQRKQLAKFYKTYEKNLVKIHTLNKEAGIPPDKYNEQDFKNTVDPSTGFTNFRSVINLKKDISTGKYLPKSEMQLLKNSFNSSARSINNQQWFERGPYNVGGRTRAIMFDPNDATGKKVFAGGVSGGLWVNNDVTNVNSEWNPIGDFWANTSVVCITADPNNSQIFYVGTGESCTYDNIGSGIWKTTDGGSTWNNIFSFPAYYSGSVRRGNFYINDIKVRNNAGVSEVFVGVSGGYNQGYQGLYEAGLYKSTDGGQTFAKNSTLIAHTGANIGYDIQQIEIGADNSVWVSTRGSLFGLDSGGKIFKSTDGNTFANVYDASLAESRVNFTLSKTNAGIAYALLQGDDEAGEPVRIIKTTNGGTSWVSTNDAVPVIALPIDGDTDLSANDFTRGQSFYDLVITTDPNNDDIVYTGGIDLFKSTDGAASWTQISKWSNNNNLAAMNISIVHADQHAIVFNPRNTNQFLVGNDGGIFFANNKNDLASAAKISARNTRYNTTQYYYGSLNPISTPANEEFLCGAQDNGSQIFYGAPLANSFYTHAQYNGGDGGFVEYDEVNNYQIDSYVQNNHFIYSITNNAYGNLIEDGNNRDNTGHFINEAALDRNKDIFFSYKQGLTLFKVTGLDSQPLNLVQTEIAAGVPSSGEQVSALKVSPYTTATTTLFVGSNLGKLYKITSADSAAPVATAIVTPFAGSISDIEFGANENEILVTLFNYGAGIRNIYYTTDGGANWSNKENNLPDMPVRTVFMNPVNQNEVILGTELGIWGTTNFLSASPTWSQYSNGLGNVRVTGIDYRPSTRTLLATTYGRGAFTSTNTNDPLSTADVNKKNLSRVYPNPTRGELHIKFESVKADAVNIDIFDGAGRLVYQQNNVKSDEAFTPNISAGSYVLKAVNAKTNEIVLSSVFIKK